LTDISAGHRRLGHLRRRWEQIHPQIDTTVELPATMQPTEHPRAGQILGMSMAAFTVRTIFSIIRIRPFDQSRFGR
jgi:hypothetical protein